MEKLTFDYPSGGLVFLFYFVHFLIHPVKSRRPKQIIFHKEPQETKKKHIGGNHNPETHTHTRITYTVSLISALVHIPTGFFKLRK